MPLASPIVESLKQESEDIEPVDKGRVAKALFNKGITLGQLGRGEEAMQVYDEVVKRYGKATEPALRAQVDKARRLKGNPKRGKK